MSAGEDRLAAALNAQLKEPWAIYRNVAWIGFFLAVPCPARKPRLR
jgi:hypothetical protein